MTVHVVGAGLAGVEATWQLVRQEIPVVLHEMRPGKKSAAHKTALFGELVCSNSLRAGNIENAVGLLKEEMRRLDSLVMRAADLNSVPAGGALAVDRENFAAYLTSTIKQHPLVTLQEEEITSTDFGDDYVIFATGPLTSEALINAVGELVHEEQLNFFDAAAPIVEAGSLNMDKIFRASRYGKGEAAYLNCPFTKEEYLRFYTELINAEAIEPKDFEKKVFFEACMPIEEMAKRGEDTMRFGPLKPVGLPDPHTGEEPYAVVQLRQDNAAGTLYNIVGFQTHLRWLEQKRVFGLIPGLEEANFVRYGVMHKNTYINSPRLLNNDYSLRNNDRIYFAGQFSGVEGYVESAASGLLAGFMLARKILGKQKIEFPPTTAIASLANYVSNPLVENFQPMNINFGLMPRYIPTRRIKKREKNALIAERSLKDLQEFLEKQ